MHKYQKINSIYKRDDKGRFTSEYAQPEFEYLRDVEWELTEKIDGTNIRIGFEEGELRIGLRTDRSQIPAHLYEFLHRKFKDFIEDFTLFGEGYGAKINGGGKYISDGVGFILFDVRVGDWWLKREDVQSIAGYWDVPIVPLIGLASLDHAIAVCKHGFQSHVAGCEAEGIVARTPLGLKSRNGQRIITKVKVRDFE